jgi:non-structural maintenance of chromosomes element 4
MEDAPVVRPSVVTFGTNEEASSELSKETSENVMKLYSVLETVGSFPFYHFITDPDSFSRTVENLFYVSFLVRDNRARIFIPEYPEASNELFIEAVISEDENYPEEAKSSDFNQMILGMTSKVWRKSIEKYNIVKPFLSYS